MKTVKDKRWLNYLITGLIFLGFGVAKVSAQTQQQIYFTNFDTIGATSTAGVALGTRVNGWTSSGAQSSNLTISSGSSSTTYTGASGTNNLADGASSSTAGTAIATLSGQINPTSFQNLQVSFGYRASSASYTGTVTLDYSTDGTTWNSVSLGTLTRDGSWRLLSGLSVGSGQLSATTNLRFRFTFVRTNTSGNFRIDDFKVTGVPVDPTITSFSPTSAAAGGSAFTLSINGTNFINSLTSIKWNGTTKATTWVSSTQVQIPVTTTDIQSAGSIPIVATTTGAQNTATSSFSVTSSNAPTKLVITSVSPASPTVGAPFSITIQSQDNSNIAQTVSSNLGVTLAVSAGTITGGSGTISSGSSSVTISGITVSNTGSITITASASGLTDGTLPVTIRSAASKLVITAQPTTGFVGYSLPSAFTVQAQRSDNSVDSTYSGTVSLSVASGPGSLTGGGAISFSNGSASFSSLVLSTNGTYTIQAASSSLTSATSSNIVISTVTDLFWTGTGTWNSTNSNWGATTGGAYSYTWQDGKNANFEGTPGTVTLGTPQSTPRINFIQNSTSAYTLTGSSVLTLSGSRPSINIGSSSAAQSTYANLPLSASDTVVVQPNSGVTTTTGTFNFGAANTFSKGIVVQSGVSRINFNHASAAGTNPIYINASGMRFTNSGTTADISAASTVVSMPAIVLNPYNSISNLTVGLGATGNTNLTRIDYNGVISGTVSKVFVGNDVTDAGGGTGVTRFNAANTYVGQTVFNNNSSVSLQLGIDNAIPTNSDLLFHLGNGGLNTNGYNQKVASLANATVGSNVGSAPGGIVLSSGKDFTIEGTSTTSYSGVISGSGNLVLGSGHTGNQTLAGTNTYSGNTTLLGGTLTISSDAGLGTAPGTATYGKLWMNGGTLATNTSFTLNANRGIVLGSTSGTGNGTFSVGSGATLTYGGIITDTTSNGYGKLIKTGSGTLALTVASTFRGGAQIDGGTISVNGVNRIGNAVGTLTINNGTFAITTSSFSSSRNIVLGNINSSISVASGISYTVNSTASISGSGALNLTGAGTLVMKSASTYTGVTNVNSGELIVDTTGSIAASSDVTIASGAKLSGSGIVNGNVTLNGTVGKSAAAAPDTLTLGSNGKTLTLAPSSTIRVYLNNTSGSKGVNWDYFYTPGSINITATSSNPIVVNVNSLTAANASGSMQNFNNTTVYTWVIATADGGITGFSSDKFSLVNTGVSNTLNSNYIFKIINAGNDILLTYTLGPSVSITGTLSNFGTVAAGNTSAEQSYSISGVNLNGDVTVTAPAHFRISLSSGSYTSNANSLVLTPTNGTLNATTIYVQFNPTTGIGSVSNPITHSTSGATTQNQTVAAVGLAAAPTTQTTSITFTSVYSAGFTANFSGGNGSKRLVTIKLGSTPPSGLPVNGTTYSAGTLYGVGDLLAPGEYVVFAGSASSVTITGLQAGGTYSLTAYSYNDNGVAGAENYLTASPSQNSQSCTISSSRFTSSSAGAPWLTASNWSPSGVPDSAAVARFSNVISSSFVGINMNTSSGKQQIGMISLDSICTSGTIQNSSSNTSGYLVLNGVTWNGVSNVVLNNTATGSTPSNLTITTGSSNMWIGLGLSSNIIMASSGTTTTVGNGFLLTAPLVEYYYTGSSVTFLGGGTLSNGQIDKNGGLLSLNPSIANSYPVTGGFTIGASNGTNHGVFSLGTSSAISNTTGNNIVINPYSQLYLAASNNSTYSLSNINLTLNGDGNNISTTYGSGALRTASGNTYTWTSSISLPTSSTISVTGSAGKLTLSGNISGTGTLKKQSAGELVISGGANSWSGGTYIGNGTITLNNGSSLGSTSGDLTFFQTSSNNTTLNLNTDLVVGNLSSSWTANSGTVNQTLNLNARTLTVTQTTDNTFGSGAVSTLNSIISGTGNLIKNGSAKLTLSSPNTYTGTTTLNAGTLALACATANTLSPSSKVTVNANATLQITANQTLDSLILNSNATLIVDAGDTLVLSKYYVGGGTIVNNGCIQILGVSSFPGATANVSYLNQLQINNPAGVSLDNNFTVNGSLILTQGTLTTNNKLDMANGSTIIRSAGQLSASISTQNFYNVTYTNASTIAAGSTPELTPTGGGGVNTLTVSGAGTVNTPSATALSLNGNVNITSGTLALNNNLSLKGNWSRTGGTFTPGTRTVTFNASNANQTVSATGGASFYNLTVNNTNTNGTITQGSDLSVTNALTLTNGTLTTSTNTLTFGSSAGVSRTSGAINGTSGTVQFNNQPTLPTGLFTAIGGLTVNGGTLTLPENYTLGGTLTLSNGGLNLNGKNLTLNGGFSGSSSNALSATGVETITIGGSGSLGSLFFDQTTAGTTNKLATLTVNRSGQTIALGNALQLTTTLAPTAGTLNANGNLTLLSTATRDALVDFSGSGSVTGNVTSQRYLSGTADRWRGFSAPVAATYSDISSTVNIGTQGQNGSNLITLRDMPAWNSQLQTWWTTSNWRIAADTNINATTNGTIPAGRGFLTWVGASGIAASAPATIDLTGTLNQSDVTPSFLVNSTNFYGGWMLIGNPFAANFDLAAAYAGGDLGNVNNTVYIFSPTNNGFISYNLNTGVSSPNTPGIQLLAPYQPFLIQASGNSTASITLKKSRTTTSSGAGFNQRTGSNDPVIRLTSRRAGAFEGELLVSLKADATDTMDVKYDGPMASSFNGTQFYTQLQSGRKLTINALPEDPNGMSIPVYLESSTAGNLELQPSLESVDPSMNVWLEDKVTNLWYNLRNGNVTIAHQASNRKDRFVLHLNARTTAVTQLNIDLIKVWVSSNQLNVDLPQAVSGSIRTEVLDMAGRVVYSHSTQADSRLVYNLPELAAGAYSVRVSSGAWMKNERIVISK